MKLLRRLGGRPTRWRARSAGWLAIGAVLAGVTPAADAAAQDSPVSLSVSGGPGEVRVSAGGEGGTSFVVRNPARHRQSVEVDVTGLRVEGGAYQFDGTPSPGLSVLVTPARFSVPAGGAQDVAVAVRATPTALPGGGYAGLVVRGVPHPTPGASPVIGEIGLPVFVVVEGSADDDGRIDAFSVSGKPTAGQPLDFRIEFTNLGNIHYPLAGDISIVDRGQTLATVPVEARLVLPGTTRAFIIPWSGPAPVARLTARFQGTWGLDGRHRGVAETRIVVSAVDVDEFASSSGNGTTRSAIAASVLIFAVLLWLLWFRRRGRRARGADATAAHEQ